MAHSRGIALGGAHLKRAPPNHPKLGGYGLWAPAHSVAGPVTLGTVRGL